MSIDKLRELTDKLPPAPKLADFTEHLNGSVVKYNVGKGNSLGIGLYVDDKVSVQRVYLEEGTVFDMHTHPCSAELIMCYEGVVRSTRKGGYKLLRPGDFDYLEPGEAHGGEALENSWIIAITIPPDKEGFPDK